MGYTTLVIDVSPNVTAYDEDYPTRSTELLNHQLHEMLVDMEDAAGSWYFDDNTPSTSQLALYEDWVRDTIKVVFDYAEDAIQAHRAETAIPILEPSGANFTDPPSYMYEAHLNGALRLYMEAYKIMYFIYYMWKTEEDPLLLKEKLQELLIAWPLLDTTIELSSELGQQFKVYPSWKNADLDL